MAYYYQGKKEEEDFSDLIRSYSQKAMDPEMEAYMAQRFPQSAEPTFSQTQTMNKPKRTQSELRFLERAPTMRLSDDYLAAATKPSKPTKQVPFIAYGAQLPESQRFAIERAPTVVLPEYNPQPKPPTMMKRSQTLYQAPALVQSQQPMIQQQSSTATLKDQIKQLRIEVENL